MQVKIQIIKHDKKRFTPLATIEEQLRELKLHLKGGRRLYLDARPWFLILDHDNAGSAWLRNLNLQPIWQSLRKVKMGEGVGVDITVTQEAAFFGMDESFWQAPAKDGEKTPWHSFCRLFNKKRGFKAPQGIIVCVSIKDLHNTEFQAKLGEALKENAEAYFGKVPVYLIINDLNDIPGFTAYVAKLHPEQKEQIFGFSHADLKQNHLNEENELRTLHQQLNTKILSQLRLDAGIEANSDALFFPQEFAALYPAIEQFCHRITHASPNVQRLILRGVYFTAENMFALPILSEILQKEAKAFSTWQQIDEWLAHHRKRLLVGLSAGMIGLLLVWWLGVLHDEVYLNDINAGVTVVNASANNPLAQLQALQQLYDLGEQDDSYMFRFLGIFFANKVKDGVAHQYAQALQNNFEPMMAQVLNQSLANSLKNAKTSGLSDIALLNQDAAIYNWLSSYLMLNELDHFDAGAVRNSLQQAWQKDLLATQKMSLYGDLVYFGLVQENIDPNLVAQARNILGNQPIEIRAFFALKASSNIAPVVFDSSVFNANGAASVDGFFTAAAAKQYLGDNESSAIKQTLEQSWVLGTTGTAVVDSSSIDSLKNQVNQFYWNQYNSTWQSSIAGLSIKPFANMSSAVSFLNGNAWSTLWNQMSTNLTSTQSSMASYLTPANLQKINGLLQQLGSTLSSNESAAGALNLTTSILNQQINALNQLQQLANSAPQPMQNLMNSIVTQVVLVVFTTAEHGLEQAWNSEVLGHCESVVGDSSSFVGASNTNVALEAFARFFSNNGVGGQFIANHLESLVNIKNGQVGSRSAYGVTFALPGSLQENIVRLLLIRSAFFSNGDNPQFVVNFTPMYLSKNLADFTVTDGNQSLFYQNGPRISQSFGWPNGSGDVVLKFTGLNGQILTARYPGVWGLVKFFNAAQVTVIDPTHYQLTWSLDNYSATYEVSLQNGNFAGILALRDFQCE